MYDESTGGERRKYYYLGSRLVGQTEGVSGQMRYLLTDRQGSVRAKTDANRVINYETVRGPYGSVLLGWAYQNGPALAGHMEDAISGLTYMEARYYDPVAMRFISPDPVGVSGSNGGNFNRYWYANNNPYTNIDPDGRESPCFSNRMGCGLAPVTPEVEHKQAVAMGGLVSAVVMAPAAAFVGGTAAAVIGDTAAGSLAGAVAVNGPEIVTSTVIVAEGIAGASGAMIPSSALVVRGGSAANQTAAKIDAAIGPSRTPGVTGFSAQCNGGTCLSTLSAPLRNNQVGVTTVGEIRAAGGGVVPTPGLGNHVTVTNLPGEKASPLFKVVRNPNPKQDRP